MESRYVLLEFLILLVTPRFFLLFIKLFENNYLNINLINILIIIFFFLILIMQILLKILLKCLRSKIAK